MHVVEHRHKTLLFILGFILTLIVSAFQFGAFPSLWEIGRDLIPFLLVAIAIGYATYRDQPLVVMTIATLLFVASIYIPGLVFYYPLILYTAYKTDPRFDALLLPLSMFFQYAPHFLPQAPWLMPSLSGVLTTTSKTQLLLIQCFITCLSVIVVLLKNQVHVAHDFKRRYVQTCDASREMELNLKRQHLILMEKQDSDLQMATLNERNRIAREMHDHAGHQLSRAILQLGAITATAKACATSQANFVVGHELDDLKTTLDAAMDSLRSSVHNLHSESIDLDLALHQISADFSLCPIHLNLNFDAQMPVKMKLAILGIVKEGLSNVIKHAQKPNRVDLSLIEHPSFYQLILSDNGLQTSQESSQVIEKSNAYHSGIGLTNISHRVNAFNGHFLVKKNQGFTLFITFPKEKIPCA